MKKLIVVMAILMIASVAMAQDIAKSTARSMPAISVAKAPVDMAPLYLVNGNLMTEAQVDAKITAMQTQKDKYLVQQVSMVDAQLKQWQDVKAKIVATK